MSGLTLGSLFDGIGVFPLAASRCDIRPLWASEIEAAPISITRRHFPDMAHLGDITKLDGGAIPPVHVLTFGSPCQNLSQIGRREGLDGTKSGLFFHAIRIIQEMRKATNDLYPVISVWENVMGAFSSNDRMDFRAVLSAFTDTEISMPASGRWANAGMVRGGCPDLAWRLLDAQHWARPRLARRQRVFLVADFGGRRAPEILFKPRPMLPLPAPCTAGGLPAPGGDRGPVLETGGRVPVTRPFQGFRMRGAAKEGEQTAFQNSFGFPTDPFPTLLAGTVTPFAFWYEDDPAGGCIRFPTELECERLMGLPEGWTKYGADGREISASQRYKALGNAIALPCAEYIMAGVQKWPGRKGVIKIPYVNVPNDLSKVKTKLAFNLTKRQLVCFGIAAAVGVPSYLLARSSIGNTGAMFLMMAVALPAFLLAMYEKDGLPLEKVVRNIIRARFLRPGVRPYRTENIYAPFTHRGAAGKEDAIAESKKSKARPRKGR